MTTCVADLQSPTFEEIMAVHLRRTPWFAASLGLHLLVLLALALWPHAAELEPDRPTLAFAPVEPEPEIEPPVVPPPPIDPEVVPIDSDEPIVVEPSTNATSDAADDSPNDTAFDAPHDLSTPSTSVALAPVGLGGGGLGGGGKYGNRGNGNGHPGSPHIDRALAWLARHQDADGRWDADNFMKHDIEGEPCDGAGNPTHDVGVTGLALLAFLGDGHLLNREGPYRDVLQRGVLWLREQQDPQSGRIGAASSNEFVYDHTIATLALVEACGLANSRILRPTAQKAIDYLEAHRSPYSVWRYQPRDNDADTSVTGWCVLAYTSARDFGFVVNPDALALALSFFESMTDPATARTGYVERGGRSSRRPGDHGTRYPRERGECMTAVSLLCRVFLTAEDKAPDAAKLRERQADLLLQQPPVWDVDGGSIDHYAWYYATYAMFQIGGRRWTEWAKALGAAVRDTQRDDGNALGSWDPVGVWGSDGGRVYSTAILCLTLEAYTRYARVGAR